MLDSEQFSEVMEFLNAHYKICFNNNKVSGRHNNFDNFTQNWSSCCKYVPRKSAWAEVASNEVSQKCNGKEYQENMTVFKAKPFEAIDALTKNSVALIQTGTIARICLMFDHFD